MYVWEKEREKERERISTCMGGRSECVREGECVIVLVCMC